jgi:hypothetical protein
LATLVSATIAFADNTSTPPVPTSGPVKCAMAAFDAGLTQLDIARLCAGAASDAPVKCAQAASDSGELGQLDWATLCAGAR